MKPILKKPSDDSETMKNYRPVSNLPYISKIIEKVAVDQLDAYLTDHDLHEPLHCWCLRWGIALDRGTGVSNAIAGMCVVFAKLG